METRTNTRRRERLVVGLIVLVTLSISGRANSAEFACVIPVSGKIDRLVADQHDCPGSDKVERLARLIACVGEDNKVQQLLISSSHCGDGQRSVPLRLEEPSDAFAASEGGDERESEPPDDLPRAGRLKDHPLELVDVRFSNVAKDGSPLSGPTDRLDVATVIFVGWKANFRNQLYKLDSGKYRVDATYIAPDGRTLGTIADWKIVPASDQTVTFAGRVGNSNGGAFLPGSYTVNFFLNGKYIAQQKFDIVGTASGG
jgi:hypothetical protein